MESETEHMASNSNEIKENLKKKLLETTVIDNFTKLTSEVEKIRVNAGVTLLKHLNSIEDSDKKQCEFSYTLDRLVRGVGATKYSSKIGFYSFLVVLLKNQDISIKNVFESIKKHLSTATSKSEDSNVSMGQILVCGALIHSGKFKVATNEEQTEILNTLITAGKKKSYLSLAAFTFIVELIENVDEQEFKFIWEIIKTEISKPWKEQSLDTVYVLLKAKNKFPNVIKNKYILKTMDSNDIVHLDSVKHLADILMNMPTISTIKHPLFPEIAKQIVERSLEKELFSELDLLLPKQNRNKQLIITHLLILTLENLTNFSVIPDILTNNYIKYTLQTFKHTPRPDKDDEFFIKMELFFKTLTEKLKDSESKTKLAVIKKLLFYPGTFIFEKITKTKVIQHIVSGLNEEGVKKLSKLYKEVVLATKIRQISETDSENWINMDRIYAANLIVKLLSHNSVQKNLEWRLEQLKFFLQYSLLKTENIGQELSSALKDCFYHALDQKLPKLEDLRNILSSIVHYINDSHTPDEEIKEAWQEMMNLVTKIESKKFKKNYALPVFHTLVLHMGLQLFNDVQLAQNSLKELHSCFARLEVEKKKKKLKEGEMEDEEPEWIEVVVDLFLSLLSHNSHLLRSIINCVFPYLCPHLSLTALRQILDILDPKIESNPLSKDSDDESDESDLSSSEDENEDSGLEDEEEYEESATDKMRQAVRQALHKTGYQTDDESEDMDNMDEEEGKKLDAALAEAFKMKKTSKGRSNKQNKDDKALTHFRVRVLDLIEIYLDSEPVMLNCLEIACLLLQTLEFSIRDVHQKPLEHRVRSCLKKLSNIKKFSSTEDTSEDILATMLKSFLDKGSKSAFIYQDMGDIIAECCIFTIRCSQIINSSDKITEIFRESLETFFEKRDCLLPVLLFKNVLQIIWDGNWALVPLLVNFAFNNDIRPFRRSQALDLLKIFYNNSRFRTSNLEQFKQNISPLEKQISSKTIELLSNPKDLKEKSVCLLLNLLTSIKAANGSNKMNWDEIGKSVHNYRSQTTLAKDAKMAYNKFCRTLGITNIVKMQIPQQENGHNESSSESEPEKEKTPEEKRLEKKRKKNSAMKKEKQKAKKEARLLRMKASAEGLGDFNFSNVDLPEEQEEPKKKKHKKDKQQNGDVSDEEKPQERRKKKTQQNGTEIKLNGDHKRHNSESDERPKKKKKNRD